MDTSPSPILFNVASSDITPSEATILGGFANRRGTSLAAHRPLSCQCLALRSGEDALCLITCDLLEADRSLVERVQRQVSEATGVRPDHVLVHFTHTHSAPYMEPLAGAANGKYVEFWIRQAVDAARRAMDVEAMKPCTALRHGRATATISTSRSMTTSETGKPRLVTDPGGLNDPSVEILRLEADTRAASATLLNFACHPVTLGGDSLWVSPDFPGKTREYVEQAWGGTALYFSGFAGDINPLETGFTNPRGPERYGEILGQEILEAGFSPGRHDNPDVLRVRTVELTLPYRDRHLTAEFVQSEVARKSAQQTEFVYWQDDLKRWGEKVCRWIESGLVGEGLGVRLVAARVGPAVLLFSPGEVFIHYQIVLRELFPDIPLFCIGYTGGETGYIPTARAFDSGRYETDLAYVYTNQPSPLTPEVETVFLDGARRLIESVL